jgi:hypothetical protein
VLAVTWLVSTIRYFGPCPICRRLPRGGEVTYDLRPAETELSEQTHACCCRRNRPPVLLVAELWEPDPKGGAGAAEFLARARVLVNT